ncbi:MAG: alpha/beta fold hydrolase [Candidatus Aminicenantaceae bacterium]
MKRWSILICVFGILFTAGATAATLEEDYAGIWQGTLKIQSTELRLVFKIEKAEGGGYTATWDSPDQSAMDLPMDSVTVEEGAIVMVNKQGGVEVRGTLQPDGKHMQAVLKQAGMELPLELEKVEKVEEVKRPQTPQKPFPFREEEATYENQKAGITITGTLTLPQGEGPFPAVLLITGSGAQNRDETIFNHKPFLVIADHLTRRGIAVLRVDDRGVGGTTGNLGESTTDELAGDVLTGVAFLKDHKEIDPERIGLIGHSEGGIIAPMAAARSEDVAFIILLAGTGLTGEEILYMQSELIQRANGMSEEDIQTSLEDSKRIYGVLKSGKDKQAMEEELRRMYEEDRAKLSEEEREEAVGSEKAFEAQIKQVLSVWFLYFLTYDPRPVLLEVSCPVLALNGEKDLQVPPKENLAEIGKALKAGGNRDVTLREMPGLNHLFQTAETGAVSEYGKIEETIAPEVLQLVGDWILERVGKK